MGTSERIRSRIAVYAYVARFEVILDAIEGLGSRLAPEYPKGRSLGAGIRTF